MSVAPVVQGDDTADFLIKEGHKFWVRIPEGSYIEQTESELHPPRHPNARSAVGEWLGGVGAMKDMAPGKVTEAINDMVNKSKEKK